MLKSRILIVDDDRTARQLLVRILDREGFEALACGDGREAMQLVHSERPALIVSDYEMPEFTGAQLCEMVRQSEIADIANTPIILLTAHAGEQHEVESLEAGANDFVTKPVNAAVLRARIDTQLRLQALRQQSEMQKRELEDWRRAHELDLEAAQLTQRAILPTRVPKIEGWQTAAHYQPVIQVGGDMYDWLKLADGRWLFWVSDATGHGASAALLTTLTKLVFRHAASEESQPGEIMRAVNAEFHSILRGKSFMTAACIVVEPGSGRLVFSGAGHPPLLLSRVVGPAEALRSASPPLGILGDQKFSEVEAELQPGEAALLYSDGLYSAQDRDGEYSSPEDLAKALPMRFDSAEELAELVISQAYARNPGEALPDDLTVLVLRRTVASAV